MLDEMEMEDKDPNKLEDLSSLRISSLEEEEVEVEEDDCEDDDDVDEEEEEEDDEDEVSVALGFVEKPKNPRLLLRHLFPSKAGGVPAWLDPVNLPLEKSRVCGFCGEPLQFLLQVYAPISEKESAFHRMLFVFMCTSMACLLQDQHEQWKRRPETQCRSVKVFRCQLPRSNPFYSSEPPRHDGTDKPSRDGAALCCLCGTWKGEKVCGSCKKARYCSEKHQVMHWRLAHKVECRQICATFQTSDSSNNQRTLPLMVSSKTLWPEYEIVSEDECSFDTEASEASDDKSSLVSKAEVDETFKSLLDKFEGNDDQRSWASFQGRIAKAPEQVLRYCRDVKAKPLWPMSSGRPSNADIPKCSYCGGPLCYEFQVLSQLLYYFGVKNDVDSLDWATIVAYTCMASCEASVSYKEEFVWVQLSSSSPI
ncbi:programmed cell death protein 2 isoform X1 [Cinnamomum micranthum f. kanehirae]|uniref:Programmed cell death protein 2 isoform X1 n=1 Tax=Cinnamomum micranthum f. kanehirae TaxID=337451 RepID=A0A3S3PY93_9MAGN|nr:programmed cell death protein 2 isoform X1 [Cinnamomum micranthum f. kanehirae]